MLVPILFAFLVLLLLHLFFRAKFGYWKQRGLAGPTPIWFFGTMLSENLFFSRKREREYYERYGPCFGTYACTQPYFNTSDPEHIKQVLSQPSAFGGQGIVTFNDKYLERSLLFKTDHKWKAARTAMSHYFTSHKLRSLMGHYELVTGNFLANVEQVRRRTGSDLIDVRQMTKCFGMDMIAKVALAIDLDSFKEQESEFVRHCSLIGNVNIGQFLLMILLPAWLSKLLKLNIVDVTPSNKLGELFKRMIRERQETGLRYHDLAEEMRQQVAEKQLDLTEDEIIGNLCLLFFAGVDTVSGNLCHMLYLLTEYPEVKERLYAEIKRDFASAEISYEALNEQAYLDAFFKEAIRFYGQMLSMERVAAQDTKIGQFRIEKGCGVLLQTYLVHNNPDYFPEPNKFKPERWLDRSASNENKTEYFWPFGGGIKNCLGMRLATIEMKYFLIKLLLNYDVYKPANFRLDEISVRRFSGLRTCSLCFRKRSG